MDVVAKYQALIHLAPALALSTHKANNAHIWHTEQAYRNGETTLGALYEHMRTILDAERPSRVYFQSQKDFETFCVQNGGDLHEQYVHEMEHAQIYMKYNVACIFGFLKIHDEGKVGLIPWVQPCWNSNYTHEEQLAIQYEALENATNKSESDKNDIAAIKQLLRQRSIIDRRDI